MQTQTPLKNKLRQRRSAAKPLAQLFTSLSELVKIRNYYKATQTLRVCSGYASASARVWSCLVTTRPLRPTASGGGLGVLAIAGLGDQQGLIQTSHRTSLHFLKSSFGGLAAGRGKLGYRVLQTLRELWIYARICSIQFLLHNSTWCYFTNWLHCNECGQCTWIHANTDLIKRGNVQ